MFSLPFPPFYHPPFPSICYPPPPFFPSFAGDHILDKPFIIMPYPQPSNPSFKCYTASLPLVPCYVTGEWANFKV